MCAFKDIVWVWSLWRIRVITHVSEYLGEHEFVAKVDDIVYKTMECTNMCIPMRMLYLGKYACEGVTVCSCVDELAYECWYLWMRCNGDSVAYYINVPLMLIM
jgi:hypothetical protein